MTEEQPQSPPLATTLRVLAQHSQQAARVLARAPAEARTRAITALADGLQTDRASIEAANARDLNAGREAGLSDAMLDRLSLCGSRLDSLEASLRAIAEQSDPIGEVTRAWSRPNGLEVSKVRLPLGVILMIYESRPNVTMDAAALCLRSGNAAILRGGSEAAHTNAALAEVARRGLDRVGLPEQSVTLVPTQAREAIDILITLDDFIDLVIPRGGEALIRRVAQGSRIPVVRHYKGVCQIFVERTADLAMALDIIENAKTQRPGVCNAAETLLVDAPLAAQLVPACVQRLRPRGVQFRACPRALQLVDSADDAVTAATDADWDTEFLGLTLAVRVVDGVEGAIAHIDRHGTRHTASVVTRSPHVMDRFTAEIDASCVLVNASTRFNDGGELGLGAEMGISTTRVHAYGPMGVESLTAEKFVVRGNGQTRT